MSFFSASLTRARASTDHFFFCLWTLMKLTTLVDSEFPSLALQSTLSFTGLICTSNVAKPAWVPTIAKRTHVLLAFCHTYVLLASNNYTFHFRVYVLLSPCHVYLLFYTLYGYLHIRAILMGTGDMPAGALVVVSTCMGDRLSSGPAVGCVWVGISLCPQTFINSSALLVSLMALRSR